MNYSLQGRTDFEQATCNSKIRKAISELTFSVLSVIGALGMGYAAIGPIEIRQYMRQARDAAETEEEREERLRQYKYNTTVLHGATTHALRTHQGNERSYTSLDHIR